MGVPAGRVPDGVDPDECGKVGSLLGIKLVLNEHVAFVTMTKTPEFADLSPRSKMLAVYALTGFANFASVGIQLGGIGADGPGAARATWPGSGCGPCSSGSSPPW